LTRYAHQTQSKDLHFSFASLGFHPKNGIVAPLGG